MKKLIFLVLFIPSLCLAQEKVHWNTMVVFNDTIKFNELVSKLAQEGFGIQYANEQAGVITSSPKKIKRCSIVLNIARTGKTITINGNWDSGTSFYLLSTSTKLQDQIEFRGMDNSLAMNSWEAMLKFANSIGGFVQFEKR